MGRPKPSLKIDSGNPCDAAVYAREAELHRKLIKMVLVVWPRV